MNSRNFARQPRKQRENMAETDTLYLENLEEIVNDENKIITYKGLSSLLNVPANRAKEMLSTFVDQQSSKGNQLNVTFLLGGISTDSGKKYRFLLVMKKHLEAMKSKFSNVSCCHIYSVQKSSLKSFDVLHGVDIDMTKSSLFDINTRSNIFCPDAKQSDAVLRRKQTVEESQVLTNGFHSKPSEALANSSAPSQPQASSKTTTSKSSSNSKQISSASFFGKSTKLKKERDNEEGNPGANSTNDKQLPNLKTDKKAIPTKKEEKQGLVNFGKAVKGKRVQDGKTENEDDNTEKRSYRENEEEPAHKSRKKDSPDVVENDRHIEEKIEEQEEDEVSSKSSKRTKRKKDQIENSTTKRRKTSPVDSDSEEDDNFESFIKSSKEEEICTKASIEKTGIASKDKLSKKKKVRGAENSLEIEEKKNAEKCEDESNDRKEMKNVSKTKKRGAPDNTKEESRMGESSAVTAEKEDVQVVADEGKPKEKRRIRKRVLKSKTFMNDEGYMVTEKVYESESASEESETEEKVKETSKLHEIVRMKPDELSRENKKIKAEASKNRTQSSLMSFFKKK